MLEGFARTRTAIIGIVVLLIGLNGHDHVCEGLQYQPVEIYGNSDECALILDGPGRTSVFDYTYNLLRGNFPPTAGSQTCITYDAVNHAYIEARKRINVAQPKNEIWRPEDLATVGELLLDISTNLAQTYGLSFEEIEKSLPLIDTSKTLIREVCPAFLSNVECRPGKYRRYDGLCTNLQNPTWGSTLSPFTRLMPPRFSDGLSAPRIAVSGRDLPLSRIVSRTMHPDEGYHDHAGTVMVIAWGQFMDHDYTLTGTPLDPLNRNDPEECCSRPPHLKNPYCNEIRIPEDDYFYRLFNVQCMDFVRAFPAVRPGCRLGSRVPFNLLTGVLDGNTVYGITENFARKLRNGYGGLLRMNPVFNEYGLKDLLPLKLDIPDEGCTRPNKSMYCFEAGEIRVNEQLVLTCMHTLVAREHNRIAKVLTRINPHWDDETLFQESRRIVIAEIQHITYNEFLPILLGKDVMEKFGLLLEKNGYWDGYDPTVNPGVIDAFAAAAFRFGHSLLPTAVERWSKAHKFIASKRLSDLIRRPYDLYRAGVLDEYFMGLMNQVAQAMDDSITQEVTNHLFKKVGAKFGMDLVSFNMQRGREFGIPSYMDFRKYCGLPEANTFDELFGSMPNETIGRYSSIFEHPADVDLWSGGVSERPLPGSMLGPTFACIIATQFSHSRRGDRFWYELPNQPASFTLDQLNEIRKTKLAKMICDNTDLIDTIQIYPMVLPDHEINPRVPCRSGVLPSIDLSKWAEYPTSHATQYHQQSRKTNRDVKNVLPKRYAKLFNPNLMKIIKRKDKYAEKRYTPLLWTRLIEKVSTSDVLSLSMENNNIVLIDNEFKQSSDSEAIKISSIIEKIIKKNKGMKNARKRNRSFRKINKSMTGKRLKRSANENSNSSAEMKNNLKLYRHPKLTQEDEKSKITDTNVNVYTDFYKRIWEIINDTRPTFKIVVPPMRTHREIFKDEDVTSGSEIEDLNFPYKETGSLNEKKKLFIGIPFDERRPPEEDEFDKYVKVDMENVDNCSTLKPIVESKNEMIIINPDEVYVDSKETKDLSDNKSSTNDSTKLKKYSFSSMPVEKLDNNKLVPSVPDYDPDKIPYVEIPDYSDEREESLDEEDRRLAKKQYIDPNNFSNISNNYTDKITTLGYENYDKNNNEDANKDQSILTRGATNIKLSETSNHEKKNHLKKNNKNVRSQSEVRKNTDEGFVLPEIQFDINEYNKPFDLDDFLKSEPFFQKFPKTKNNNNNNNKRENGKELVDDAKSNYSSMSEDPTREDLVDDDEWEPRYKRANENTRMDHMKLDYTKDQGRIDEMINEEKDFLERYFSKDVIDKLEEHSDEEFGEETKRKEKEEEKKKKTLKTLSTILDKKDRISRLDEEVNKEIEENGRKVPSVYKNYWSLEYELPGMKDIKKEMKKIY